MMNSGGFGGDNHHTQPMAEINTDGNARMGRLWQTLILLHWKPLLAYLSEDTFVLYSVVAHTYYR